MYTLLRYCWASLQCSWHCLYALFSFHILYLNNWKLHFWYALCTFCNWQSLHWAIEIDSLQMNNKNVLSMDYRKWHLVCALLQLTFLQALFYSILNPLLQRKPSLYNFAIDNFSIHYCKYSFISVVWSPWKNYVCTIESDKFCMHYFNEQLLYALKEATTFVFTFTLDNNKYYLFQVLLQLLIHIGSNAINYFRMHYCSC